MINDFVLGFLENNLTYEFTTDRHSEYLDELIVHMDGQIKMIYLTSMQVSNFVLLSEDDKSPSSIIWDNSYWLLYEYLLTIKNLVLNENTTNIPYYKDLVNSLYYVFFALRANSFSDKSLLILKESLEIALSDLVDLHNTMFIDLEAEIICSKFFALCHEISHFNFAIDKRLKKVYIDFIYDNVLRNITKKEKYDIQKGLNLTDEMYRKYLESADESTVEELAADLSSTIATFKLIKGLGLNDFEAALLLSSSMMNLLSFNIKIDRLSCLWESYLPLNYNPYLPRKPGPSFFNNNKHNVLRNHMNLSLCMAATYELGKLSDTNIELFDRILAGNKAELFEELSSEAIFDIIDNGIVLKAVLGAEKFEDRSNTLERSILQKKIIKDLFSPKYSDS